MKILKMRETELTGASTWDEFSQAIIVCKGIPHNCHWRCYVHPSKEPAGIVCGRLDHHSHIRCSGMDSAQSSVARLTCNGHCLVFLLERSLVML